VDDQIPFVHDMAEVRVVEEQTVPASGTMVEQLVAEGTWVVEGSTSLVHVTLNR
jgi:hypothetical protein